MILRIPLSGIAIWFVYEGVLMLSCGSVGFEWPLQDSIWACYDAADSGLVSGAVAGSFVIGTMSLFLLGMWIPYYWAKQKDKPIDATPSLLANLKRVNGR